MATQTRNQLQAKRVAGTAGELFKEGKVDAAVEKFTEALDIIADEDENEAGAKIKKGILLNRSAALIKIGEDEIAVDDCTEVLEMEPGNTKALFRRAKSLVNLDRLQEALEDAKAAAEKEAGARGLVEEIEAKLKSRIPEGEPTSTSEKEQLATLKQLSGMLAPPLASILGKLLGHWETTGGAEVQASAKAREQLQAENAELRAAAQLSAKTREQLEAENAELRARCQKLSAAADAAAASLAAAGARDSLVD